MEDIDKTVDDSMVADNAQEDLNGYRSKAMNTHSELNEVETIMYDELISKEEAPASVKEHDVVQNVKIKLDEKLLEFNSHPI
ncbi:hypothetical protein DPMN_165824 [Dreissena polymorpha]|uniref:Uncharacterized protein n=1 Tax=Dreissena polymorpha TaxID=45954 RepID=A0A9D4F1E6_DREPO|nr:hypothetical protein DPMN_165824 [Dreissena polymorpha]